MELHDFAAHILQQGEVKDKLLDKKQINLKKTRMDYPGAAMIDFPVRNEKIRPIQEQIKFPRKKSLHDKKRRAVALHFFANHELLAIEMLACALYVFPCQNDEDLSFKKSLLSTLVDEQRHFELYLKRMGDLGVEFGDYPVNDFFWKYMKKVESRHEFLSVLALTFESANLDFSSYYAQIFRKVGDIESAQIMDEIYKDEISHVAVGAHWLKKWRGDKDLWQYYLSGLPELLTPARAKGITLDKNARLKAGLDDEFIDKLSHYQDDFNVTQRREWKAQ